uniref:collagen alpha-1(XIV) chain-like n=1 Tax=Myxine glutinosa TaxID=7769 RepID=UPI00358F3533
MKPSLMFREILALAALLCVSLVLTQAPSSPRNLKVNAKPNGKVIFTWRPPSEPFQNLKLIVTQLDTGMVSESMLPRKKRKMVVGGLSPGTEFGVSLVAINRGEASQPAAATFRTHGPQRSAPTQLPVQHTTPIPSFPLLKTALLQRGCVPGLMVDLVFVVDGSWSVSLSNFRLIQQFMQTMVQRLDVSPQAARIGAVQYGTDARIEFRLGKHRSTAEASRAVGGMSYKGGNTMTGEALSLAFKTGFEGKAREGAARVVVLITDGKSQDELKGPVQRLKESGVELFVLGIKAADEEELQQIASLPTSDHIFVVPDFRNLAGVEDEFSRRICASIARQMGIEFEEIAEPEAPQLRIVQASPDSIRVAWDEPAEPITSYRLSMCRPAVVLTPGFSRTYRRMQYLPF